MGDQSAENPMSPSFVPVCALGASAGGVGVLQTLFRLLPDDLGLAYVVVVHLAPDHPSAMHEILQACTRMPVYQVLDGPALKANCVYIIPPDRELVIDGDDVKARPFTDPRGRRAPIDMFFRSVAAGRGDGIAVVLTGAGSDGAVGVRAIKEAGGIVMVQEPAEAGFPSMPQSAIATGVADIVAPVARLAERIAEAARSKEAVRSLDEGDAANDLRRIIAFLRTRTGHDFSGYKRSTVMRRVMRRMQVCQYADLDDYARHLRSAPEEAKALLADLLISVTQFFRDPAAFEALRSSVIRPLLEEKAAIDTHGEIRAWVVGCATGEEAYSLAILILEEAEHLKLRIPVQIFATDLDEGALATAREGRYPRTIEGDVSTAYLQRYFVDEGTHYQINRQVRDLILFATHSVVREPPFSRLDLITCRNVLIYLERTLQQHVCSVFHYGLKPDRFLFLGTAETADMAQGQFTAVDREARIYRSRVDKAASPPMLAPASLIHQIHPSRGAGGLGPSRFEADNVSGADHAAALESSAPPSALIDATHTVLHLSPTVGRFILLSAGPLSAKLPTIVRPELRLDLKLALDKVFDTGYPTTTRSVDVRFETETRLVSVHVVPVSTGEGSITKAVAYFLDSGLGRLLDTEEGSHPPDELRRLHSELKTSQEAALGNRLSYETALQELRASNEELQSLNEEYRSTSEELETSKEELQSINEELLTVNAELKGKLAIISAAHDDLQNLTISSEIGTLFLDADLRIRMFSPPVVNVFNVRGEDVGRPITNFTHRLDYADIVSDIQSALRDRTLLEREVRTVEGRWFMVRIRPYRTLSGRVEGAVVTFDDITDRVISIQALRDSEERYRELFERIDEGFCIIELIFDGERAIDYRFLVVNPAFEQHTGIKEAQGRLMRDIAPSHEQHWFENYGEVAITGETRRFEAPAKALGNRWYDVNAFQVGEPHQHRVAVVFNDVTQRRRDAEALRASEAKLREREADLARVQRIGEVGGLDIDVAGGMTSRRSPEYLRLHGLLPDGRDETHAEWRARVHPDDVEQAEQTLFSVLTGDALSYQGEYRIIRPIDGAVRWIAARADVERDAGGKALRLVGAHIDITDQRSVQESLRESEERFAQFTASSSDGLWIRDAATLAMEYTSPAIETIYGVPRDSVLGELERWVALILPEDRDTAIAHIEQARAGASVTHEFRIRRPSDGALRWIRNTDFPLRDGTGRVQRIGGIAQDVTTMKAAEAALTHSEGQLRDLVEGVSQLVWRAVDGGDWIWASPQWTAFTGQAEVDSHGRGWLAAVHPDDRAIALAAWARAEETRGLEVEYRIRNAPTGAYRWFQTRAAPRLNAQGEASEWLGTSTDVHQLKALQESQAVMVAELQHRTRNLIAVVRGIADDTMEQTGPTEAFRSALDARLAALSRVQGLLSRAEVEPITIAAVVRLELDALGAGPSGGRVSISGPDVWLRNSTVQTLALALHELATNARKYGALSHEHGRLAVTWSERSEEGERRLVLEWVETGLEHMSDHAPSASGGGGYGRELIEQALPHALGARTSYTLGETGVRCTIDIPARQDVQRGGTP